MKAVEGAGIDGTGEGDSFPARSGDDGAGRVREATGRGSAARSGGGTATGVGGAARWRWCDEVGGGGRRGAQTRRGGAGRDEWRRGGSGGSEVLERQSELGGGARSGARARARASMDFAGLGGPAAEGGTVRWRGATWQATIGCARRRRRGWPMGVRQVAAGCWLGAGFEERRWEAAG
nr:circumsporozoite protein-like [Aegilops tauschii subsp. strangulata]